MKTNIILIVFLIASCNCVAQKFISKTDPITNKTMKMAYVYVNAFPHLDKQAISFEDDGSRKWFGTAITDKIGLELYNNYTVDSLSMIIKFDDGNILRLKPDMKFSKKYLSGSLGATVILNHMLNKDELNELSNHKIIIFRIATNGDNGIDYKNIDKVQSEFLKAATYIN